MFTEQEARLARHALTRRYLSRTQIEECLSAKRSVPTSTLDEIFLARRYLTADELQELRRVAASDAAAPPRRFGPYEILEDLGRGPNGTVYRARHPRLAREATIKVVPVRPSTAPILGRAMDAARALQKLSHPNLPRLLEAGTRDGAFIVATDHVDAIPLHDHVLGRIRLPLAETIPLLKQAAAALDAAHDAGLVHGNLKPQNVLVTEMREVRLTDFGFAREDAAGLDAGAAAARAPEQWDGGPIAATDLYALGALWHFMLTGLPLFSAEAIEGVRFMHEHVTPPPLSKRVAGLPSFADAVFRKLVRKEPILRYLSPAGLVADLNRLENSLPPLPDE
jgi:serine/threonine-protein kinase